MLTVFLTCALMIGSLPSKAEAGLLRKAADTAGGVIDAIPFVDLDRHKPEAGCNGVDRTCSNFLSQKVLNGLPDFEELRTICPEQQSFIRCAIEYNSRCHPNQPSTTQIYKGQLSFINELCEPHSSIRKRYADNIQCIRGVQRRGIETNPECRQYADTIYELYREENPTKGSHVEDQSLNNNCKNALLSASCQANAALVACGTEAMNLILQIAEDSKSIEAACVPGQAVESGGLFRSALDLAGKGASTIERAFSKIFKR